MKVSMRWLDEWIEVTDLDPEELAAQLTMAGLEVDGVDYRGWGHDDIVVGRISAIEDHPDADRLVVCIVDVAEANEERTIVCGATNMEEGDRVAVALPGAQPPGLDFEIGAREVMGIHSQGMLCSAEELNLADDSDGLMIIDGDVPLGEPVFEALDLRDQVLEIDLTPNRADCLSHLGVAREVAALYGRSLRPKRQHVEEMAAEQDGERDEIAPLHVDGEQGCPHYRLAVLDDIEVGQSPQWLQQRLASVGIRSVNSVVDVTNFVLMDVGQPLHAFDLDQLSGPEIRVRRARQGESLVGIDHEKYELDPDDLVIADAERPVAIAGVMGGADTEVSQQTSRILLECAFFDPATVRRASKRHGLHTESSHRFERGIDPGAVETSIQRALQLFVSVQREATGTKPCVRGGIGVVGGAPASTPDIDLDPDRLARILGVDVGADQCRDYLESIGVEVDRHDEVLRCRVPTFRSDLQRPIDLVEEVARLHGYDEIPVTLPRMVVGERHRRQEDAEDDTIVERNQQRRLDWMRQLLLDQGLLEAVNYSFMGEEDLDRLHLDEDDCRRRATRVANPLVKSQALMRTTLIPSLLDNVETNFAQRQHDVALFEIGRRYFPSGERSTLAMATSGRRNTHWSGERSWDFFDLKGLVDALQTPWDIDDAQWARPEVLEPFLHPGVQAAWMCGERPLAFVGQVHPAVAQDRKWDQPVFVAEVDLQQLMQAGPRRSTAREPAKYPAVVRDFALLYAEDRPYAELRRAVQELAATDDSFGALFESLELFDVYEGEQVSSGLRSLAIKVTYRSRTKTLEEKEIEAADRQLLSHLEQNVDARLR